MHNPSWILDQDRISIAAEAAEQSVGAVGVIFDFVQISGQAIIVPDMMSCAPRMVRVVAIVVVVRIKIRHRIYLRAA